MLVISGIGLKAHFPQNTTYNYWYLAIQSAAINLSRLEKLNFTKFHENYFLPKKWLRQKWAKMKSPSSRVGAETG